MLQRRRKPTPARALIGLALVALVFGVMPSEHAMAAGTGNVQFDVHGRLPTFPCTAQGGCRADFSGTGTGGGEITALIGSVDYTAEFVITSGTVGGWATYTEPGPPICPLAGDAVNSMGRVTLSGGATGVIHEAAVLPVTAPGGTVTNVSYALDFVYTRVGVNARLQITGGSINVTYTIPGRSSGTFTQTILRGEGHGVFNVNAQQAQARCQFPGELLFELIGDATIVVT